MPTYAVLFDTDLLTPSTPVVRGRVALADSARWLVLPSDALVSQFGLSDALAGPTITLSDSAGNRIDLSDRAQGGAEVSDN